jgi:hypothetical protein
MHTGAPKSAKGSKKGTRTRGDSYAVSMFLLLLRFQTENAVSGSPKACKYTEIGLAFPLKSCFRKTFVPVAAYRKSTNSGFVSNDDKASHNHQFAPGTILRHTWCSRWHSPFGKEIKTSVPGN